MNGRTSQVITAICGLLVALQIVRWGALQLPIQGPLLVLLGAGLLVAFTPDAWPFKNKSLFVLSYGATFFLLWAAGHPGISTQIGGTWTVTLAGCAAMAGLIVWNAKGQKGWIWLLAIFITVAFGLFIAVMSGPSGGPDWMKIWVHRTFNIPEEEWRYANQIVWWIRKTLHFTGYGIAALCAAIAAKKAGAQLNTALIVGVAWPIPIAVFDEWQQTYATNRSGQLRDVLIDIAGMVFFLAVYRALVISREQREAKMTL